MSDDKERIYRLERVAGYAAAVLGLCAAKEDKLPSELTTPLLKQLYLALMSLYELDGITSDE